VKNDLEQMKKYESVKSAITGLSDSATYHYLEALREFCEFVGKDPDQIIKERKLHLKSDDDAVKRTYERKLKDFYEHLKKPKDKGGAGMREVSAFEYCFSTLRGFFSRNYVKLEYRRGELRRPKTEERDYIPTVGEIKEICDAADIRDKTVIILALQTGMAPVDLVNLKRGDFEQALKSGEFPRPLGWLQRHKSREPFHPFLFNDSATALKRYLLNRKDKDPHLFVDRSGEPFKERNVNDIFTKAAARARIVVPEGKRLRVYVLRKIFETQMGNAGMPQTWTDMMMGHEVKGARGAYAKPSEADWLDKAKKAEPFISISRVRNMDVLRGQIDGRRVSDAVEFFKLLEETIGPERAKEAARMYVSFKPKIEYGEDELMPSAYVIGDAAEEYLKTGRAREQKRRARQAARRK
jgi:integrase